MVEQDWCVLSALPVRNWAFGKVVRCSSAQQQEKAQEVATTVALSLGSKGAEHSCDESRCAVLRHRPTRTKLRRQLQLFPGHRQPLPSTQ